MRSLEKSCQKCGKLLAFENTNWRGWQDADTFSIMIGHCDCGTSVSVMREVWDRVIPEYPYPNTPPANKP